jgi:hypothetical protein
MSHLERALEIATAAHAGQKDKTGHPYLEHLERVAAAVDTLDEKIVAYLHDVIEKGPGWTRSRLEAEGFSPAIVSAVDALTHGEGEDDEAFVRRAPFQPPGAKRQTGRPAGQSAAGRNCPLAYREVSARARNP